MPTDNVEKGSWQIKFPVEIHFYREEGFFKTQVRTDIDNGHTNIKNIVKYVEEKIADEAKNVPEEKGTAHDKPWAVTEGVSKSMFFQGTKIPAFKHIETNDGWLTLNCK